MAYVPPNPNGQATKAGSTPVTLASDQNNALETGGNLAAVATNTAASATAANQATELSSLSTISTNTGRIPAQGPAVTSASIPVNIASDQVSTVTGDTGQNSFLTSGARKELTFTTTTTGLLLANTDISNYAWVSVQITSVGTGGVVNWQTSNINGGTYQGLALSVPFNAGGNSLQTNSSAIGIYEGPLTGRFFQLNITGLTAGTLSGTVEFFSQPRSLTAMAIAGNANVNVNTIAGVGPNLAAGTIAAGSQRTVLGTPATGTITSVASSATSVTLLAANTARQMATFFNESTSVLYIAYAATASLTAYTTQVPPNTYYEVPFPAYNGAISGIWATANGNARITQII